jgi:hypothetical protein
MTNQGSVFTCREGVSFQPPLTEAWCDAKPQVSMGM